MLSGPGRPGRPPLIDRDAIHRVLWRRSDRRGSLKFVQNQLASEIGVSPYHFSRILSEMEESGRLRTVAAGKRNVKTYVITDPAEYRSKMLTHEGGFTR